MAQAQTPAKTTSRSSSQSKDGTRSSVIERIRKPSGELRRLAACVYGRGGVGKTTLLGTMPGKGLVIDVPQVEGGTSVLADKASKIDVLPIVKWEELNDVYRYLKAGEHDYKWVAIDTLTAVQELAKRKSLAERDLAADPHQVTMQDWGKIAQLMAELVYTFRLLPIHVIFLAQEKQRDRGGEEGGTEYQPAVSPASLDALLPSLYVVGRLYVWQKDDGEWERRLRVGPHNLFLTKVRSVPGRELPPAIVEPNLGQIFAYLMGQKISKPKKAEEDSGLIEIEE